jgi:hypothetical protein
MTRTHTKATVIALIAAAGMFPILPASAQVVTPVNFPQAQRALEHQIIARQVQLASLGTNVADAANVTTSDRSALSTIITNEQTALAADATNAAAATTGAELTTVHQAVIGDERVYAVVTAQVDLVASADNDAVTEAGYTALTVELGPLVNELGSKHASALLADVTTEVTAATTLTAGVSANALALTPAGYPGNKSQIKTYTFELGQVSHDLGVAKSEVKEIEVIALGLHKLPILHRI